MTEPSADSRTDAVGHILVVDDHARARQSMADVLRHAGHEAIRATYDRRAAEVDESYHGGFVHVIDSEEGRATTRLATRRTTTDGQTIEMDCIAFFIFEGTLIKRIAIWMSGENSLK